MIRRPLIVTYYTDQYKPDAIKLIQSADRFGYEIEAIEKKSTGAWNGNCGMKPDVMATAMRKHKRPILFLDADCWINEDLRLDEEPDVDLALVVSKPEDIKPTFEVMYYKRFAMDNGGMWNSGIIYMKPTAVNISLCDKWAALCRRYTNHNDQVLMQRAFQHEVESFHAWTVGEDIWAGCDRIGHSSGFHRYWKPVKIYKYLILGSAPSVVDWWKRHGDAYVGESFIICAFNNAWKIPGKHLNIWFLPNDFDFKNGKPEGFDWVEGMPYQEYEASWFLVNPPKGGRSKNWPLNKPYWEPRNRTMIVDVSNHLLNWVLDREIKCEVHVAGADLIYKKGQTHFHSLDGDTDPLRFGQRWLSDALFRVQHHYNKAGCSIFNASDEKETRLPFPRKQQS